MQGFNLFPFTSLFGMHASYYEGDKLETTFVSNLISNGLSYCEKWGGEEIKTKKEKKDEDTWRQLKKRKNKTIGREVSHIYMVRISCCLCFHSK